MTVASEEKRYSASGALAWTYTGMAVKIACQFGIGIAIARILGPEPYGFVATSAIAMSLCILLLDGGISASLIHHQNVSDQEIAGATVQAYDPEAMEEAARIYKNEPGLKLVSSANAALENADALCVVTEWKEFWMPDFDYKKTELKLPVIFDGRNIYDPVHLKDKGFDYYGIGRSI